MAEDVLGRRQGFRHCGAGVHSKGCQPCQHFGLQKVFALPQQRLPQPGQQSLCGPLLYQKARRAFHQRHRHRQHLAGLRLCLLGQHGGGARRAGLTQPGQRADIAQGCTVGHTDQRPQLHQGLIVIPGLFRRLMFHHPGSKGLFHLRICNDTGVIIQAGKHPQHIAVHRRYRDAKADGCNGPGSVVPDAWQGPQGGIVGGQLAAVLFADDLCGLLQVAHPAVVAKTLPQFVQLFLIAGGQRRDIRQRRQKALVIRQRRRHPGLLQHHFAEPDVVGRGVLPEGQDAVVFVKPVQQGRCNVFHLFLSPC